MNQCIADCITLPGCWGFETQYSENKPDQLGWCRLYGTWKDGDTPWVAILNHFFTPRYSAVFDGNEGNQPDFAVNPTQDYVFTVQSNCGIICGSDRGVSADGLCACTTSVDTWGIGKCRQQSVTNDEKRWKLDKTDCFCAGGESLSSSATLAKCQALASASAYKYVYWEASSGGDCVPSCHDTTTGLRACYGAHQCDSCVDHLAVGVGSLAVGVYVRSCTCPNGVAKTGDECTQGGRELCDTCDEGYTLTGDVCIEQDCGADATRNACFEGVRRVPCLLKRA